MLDEKPSPRDYPPSGSRPTDREEVCRLCSVSTTLMQFYQHPSRQGSTKTKSKGSTLSRSATRRKKGTLLTDPDLKKDRAKLLTFLLTLRREIESLDSLAGKKYFTLLPEASITSAHPIGFHLYRLRHPNGDDRTSCCETTKGAL